jgi:hypothetical protein
VLSQQISTSRNAASLRLELSDGRTVDVALRGGQAYLNGKSVGAAPRGSALDDSFRDLLGDVTDARADALPALLRDWSPEPSGAGALLDRALEDAVRGMPMETAAANADAPDADAPPEPVAGLNADGTPASDSLERLNERIQELQSMVDDMDDGSASMNVVNRRGHHRGPLGWIGAGLSDIFSTLILYVVLFFIAFGIIAFGGRKYIEGVAKTAREMTMRSWLVGLAGTFLVVPAFILGIIALAISIVGIPVLLAWVPLYPIAVVASVALGFLAVAHAAGESLSERRFYENDYFQRGNAYYFLITGLGLLLSPFFAGGVIEMAGPWLGFIRGLLVFLGVVVIWAAFTIGFGAVLVSRAGTRPLGKIPAGGAGADTFTDSFNDTFTDDLDV